jgi:hypothetical protein
MKTTTSIAAAALLLGTITVRSADAAEKLCTGTSKAAREACKSEVKEELSIAAGICLNLSTKDARKACKAEAKVAATEAKDECGAVFEAREQICDALGQGPYDPVINAADFLPPDQITAITANPFFPLVPGTVWTYQEGTQTVVVTVTNDTKVIQGVTTRVVRDLVTEGGLPVEDTNDYFAQKLDGTVWYFGELVQNFENGELTDLDGSFQAGVEGAKPGIIMKASPTVGDFYRQEFALGEAEDIGEVISTTGNETVPGASCNNACLVTRDFNPHEPDVEENKYYVAGKGLILTINLENGEREELLSVTP